MVCNPQPCKNCHDGRVYGSLSARSNHVKRMHAIPDWLGYKAENYLDYLTRGDKSEFANPIYYGSLSVRYMLPY